MAAEVWYHRSCYKYFLRPNSDKPGKATLQGRKSDEDKLEAFNKLCEYLKEHDECQYSFKELKMSIMSSYDRTGSS